MDELPVLEKAKVTCASRDCEAGKHAYRPQRGGWRELADAAVCQGCGDSSVDVSVPRSRDLGRREEIFQELGREFIRDHYLDKPFDERARRLIRRYGFDRTRERALGRLASAIGREPTVYDGRQTPFEGNALFYAQHATATCCRMCAWYWYGIPREGVMGEADMTFCLGLVHAYLDRRETEMRSIATSPEDGGAGR